MTVNFKEIFEKQLTALQRVQRKQVELKFFSDTQISPGSGWKDEILSALKQAKVALLLEGRGLMTTEFIQDVELPSLLRDAQDGGLVIFRVPIGDVSDHLIPPALASIQASHPIDKPLKSLSGHKRDRAIKNIIDKLYGVYLQDSRSSVDDQPNPPFRVIQEDRSITVYPDRIAKWVEKSGFEEQHVPLQPNFRGELIAVAESGDSLQAVWRISANSRVLSRVFGEVMKALELSTGSARDLIQSLERRAAQAYPRFRDAQIALYLALNSRDRESEDHLKHSKSILLSLFRKHATYFEETKPLQEVIVQLKRRILTAEIGSEEKDKEFEFCDFVLTACRIPVFELAILCRLDHACQNKGRFSISQSYQLLDRICHWSQMSNRLMNMMLENSTVLIGASDGSVN